MNARVGDRATFIAVLNGYDKLVYDLQWQESKDGIHWENLDATAARDGRGDQRREYA